MPLETLVVIWKVDDNNQEKFSRGGRISEYQRYPCQVGKAHPPKCKGFQAELTAEKFYWRKSDTGTETPQYKAQRSP